MKVKQIAISTFAKLILGGDLWQHVRHLVSTIDTNSKLTGSQKHKSVAADLKAIFSDVGSALLNLAIELSLFWLRGVRA